MQDERENVGAPSIFCRQRRSLEGYTSCMALMTELVENEASPFEEYVEKHVWVDVMVEEYESVVKKFFWEVVPRLTDKSVVGLRWIFKIKHVADEIIRNYKAIVVPK